MQEIPANPLDQGKELKKKKKMGRELKTKVHRKKENA